MNEVKKTKQLYEVGKDLADEFRKGLIDKFTKQLNGAPAIVQASIKRKLDELTSFTPAQFLHSEFGKPLKKALVNYGVSSIALENYLNELNEETKKRREIERNEFNIKQNVFEDDISNEDLAKLIVDICKEINEGNDNK